jgi:hypothetical protein
LSSRKLEVELRFDKELLFGALLGQLTGTVAVTGGRFLTTSTRACVVALGVNAQFDRGTKVHTVVELK